MKPALLSILLLVSYIAIGQQHKRVIIQTDYNNQLIAGPINYISIIAMQTDPVRIDQITAGYIVYDGNDYVQDSVKLKVEKQYGRYFIHPKRVGVVEFEIDVNGMVETILVQVNAMQAVPSLGRFKANTEKKIRASVFREIPGIVAWVECCGFDAKCKMVDFEVIRIPAYGARSAVKNIGGKFQEAAQRLIQQAESGDMFIFRNLYYLCPGGGVEKQRSEDMVFEIE